MEKMDGANGGTGGASARGGWEGLQQGAMYHRLSMQQYLEPVRYLGKVGLGGQG